MICPCCGSREVGRLAGHHFYCWRCFVQFTIGENRIEVYEVAEDGNLVSVVCKGFGSATPGG